MKRSFSFAGAMAGLLVVIAGAMPAGATGFCHLRKTADGFVALRAEPSPAAKMVGRMRPSDEVLIGEGEKGQWVEVTWWRGTERLDKGFEKHAGKGWVNRRLIADDCG
ncbi:MAG: SH3 domain-containing protein [Beijerinckiaceae bacterium]|nr:SH3 domain-containing protein [Beijerinckiaceae bacterium]MCZ8301515.1 SH3 domain-containing protein [Beijerinckiaceae bacterium]